MGLGVLVVEVCCGLSDPFQLVASHAKPLSLCVCVYVCLYVCTYVHAQVLLVNG